MLFLEMFVFFFPISSFTPKWQIFNDKRKVVLQRRINFIFIVSTITILILAEKRCERTVLILTFRNYTRFACYRQYAWVHFHKTLFSSSAHFTIIIYLVFTFCYCSFRFFRLIKVYASFPPNIFTYLLPQGFGILLVCLIFNINT